MTEFLIVRTYDKNSGLSRSAPFSSVIFLLDVREENIRSWDGAPLATSWKTCASDDFIAPFGAYMAYEKSRIRAVSF